MRKTKWRIETVDGGDFRKEANDVVLESSLSVAILAYLQLLVGTPFCEMAPNSIHSLTITRIGCADDEPTSPRGDAETIMELIAQQKM